MSVAHDGAVRWPSTARTDRWSGTTVNHGALLHTERKLKESLTDAYLILRSLTDVEGGMSSVLAEAQSGLHHRSRSTSEAERLAEAVYCYRPMVASAVTAARLVAPAAVLRRFERIIDRPRRWRDRLPEPATPIEFESRTIDEWVDYLSNLTDLLEEYVGIITNATERLLDVEGELPMFLVDERRFLPAATAYLNDGL